jgi:predicted RNA-binding Zn ribbon-like protein
MSDTSAPGVADLVRNGGRLCLDYINTVEPRTGPVARDWLTGYPDLVEWARHGGILGGAEAAALLRAAAARPAKARAAFQAAIALRETLFRLFAAIAAGTGPADADLDVLRGAAATAMEHGRLVPRAGGFDWSWDGVEIDGRLDRPWWPVAVSAVDLLTRGPLDRIKQCPGDDGCSWLFVDATKNRSRRWCSMKDCGNDTKSRRQTDRRRAARRSGTA